MVREAPERPDGEREPDVVAAADRPQPHTVRRVPGLRVGTRRELAVLVGVGFLVMLVIALGAVFASQTVAKSQALDDSERIAERLANNVVRPRWPGYPARDRARLDELKNAVKVRMTDGNLTEVTVWSPQGQVLFSNKDEDIGRWPAKKPDQLPAAAAGETLSDFEVDEPEADTPTTGTPSQAPPGSPNRFVEVYTPLRVAGEPPMVFEAYFDYDPVDRLAGRLLRQILPLVLIPLLALQLVQIPIAISLARRIRRHESDRSRLLERALSVSDRERVRFAADLHDGPIQDLAGISYALGAVAPTVIERHAPLMARVQDALQRSIESLRGLMTDLYPPDLRSGNLGQSIVPLTNQLRSDGVDVQLDLGEVPALSEEGAAALYRVARESLANIHKHAQATTVRVKLETVQGAHEADEPWVRMVVADDGVGVDPAKMDRRAEGHLGLRLLVDRVQSLGGELVVTSAVGRGTTVRADLPVRSGGRD
jgi:two-component system NarL family sensor kinase